MKYGRTAHGERWHALTDEGVPLCVAFPSTERVVSPMAIVTTSDNEDVPRDDICMNCHEAFGRKGRRLRQAATDAARTTSRKRRDVYTPRHHFKE